MNESDHRSRAHGHTSVAHSNIFSNSHGQQTTNNHKNHPDGVGPTPLLSAQVIADRVHQLAASISSTYANQDLLLVPILRGAFIFAADLARAITIDHRIDFLQLSSYKGTQTRGTVSVDRDLNTDIAGLSVLIVEDIVDTGRTLSTTLDILGDRNPASLEVVTLLSKPSRRKIDNSVRWTGFEISDVFVVGYGLDLNEHHRQLPYLAVVEPH